MCNVEASWFVHVPYKQFSERVCFPFPSHPSPRLTLPWLPGRVNLCLSKQTCFSWHVTFNLIAFPDYFSQTRPISLLRAKRFAYAKLVEGSIDLHLRCRARTLNRAARFCAKFLACCRAQALELLNE